jgi:hypothetical protein
MREICTSGSVGRAPGNRCLYPDLDGEDHAARQLFVGLASANAATKKLQKVCLCLENLKS